ncbi:monothiol glutaredoxin grx5 [Sphagnurus paluster]|uniref:Monothiol glutaredoxin-5, mitochondrial n=1 Tax=Sphagnurus paluster TaxID=117069 RepID=A0A9P7K3X5_9AGAR|nr:monothiol glutaredoxin grx5 [Sphagnurus paluster]
MFRPTLRSSLNLIRSAAPFAHRHLTTEARAAIQNAITSRPLVLFMKGTPQLPECGFSRAVVQVLDLHGVPPEKMQTFNVLSDPELRTGIKEFSEWPTIPQIYVKGEFVGGCDILLGMHQSGELEKLLIESDIIPEELPEEPTPSQSL